MAPAERAVLERAAVCGEHFYLDALLMLERCEKAGLAAAVESEDDVQSTTPADPEAPIIDELLSSGDRATLHRSIEALTGKGLLRPVLASMARPIALKAGLKRLET